MKIEITPTGHIDTINGAPARLWRGVTDQGVKVELFVAMVRVAAGDDQAAFTRELREVKPERELVSFDYRFVL